MGELWHVCILNTAGYLKLEVHFQADLPAHIYMFVSEIRKRIALNSISLSKLSLYGHCDRIPFYFLGKCKSVFRDNIPWWYSLPNSFKQTLARTSLLFHCELALKTVFTLPNYEYKADSSAPSGAGICMLSIALVQLSSRQHHDLPCTSLLVLCLPWPWGSANILPLPTKLSPRNPSLATMIRRNFLRTSSKRSAPEFTSLASRKRRQPSCSVASLAALEDEEILENQFCGLFNKGSDSHLTWGKTQSQPILATREKGRRKKRHAIDIGASMAFLFSYHEDPEKLPNSPERSILLRFPLEIREQIYGFILKYEKSIIIKYITTLVP